MTARQRAGLAAATFAAAAMLACGDPNAPRASFDNYADTLGLYALNGAPRGAPSAISILTGAIFGSAAVPADASFNFDVALDLDDQGRPRIYPLRAVAASLLDFLPGQVRHQVGLRTDDRAFDAIPEAPENGYVLDSARTVDVGQVVIIQSADQGACNSIFGGVIHAKMIVDSVRTATRQLFVRITADPNCGFRSFAIPGPQTD
jgi:hypothetical protein